MSCGIGAIFVAEIGDVTRFTAAAKLCSWAGLTPLHREADARVHRGRITKQGNNLVRWAAVEAVQKAHTGPTASVKSARYAGARTPSGLRPRAHAKKPATPRHPVS